MRYSQKRCIYWRPIDLLPSLASGVVGGSLSVGDLGQPKHLWKFKVYQHLSEIKLEFQRQSSTKFSPLEVLQARGL